MRASPDVVTDNPVFTPPFVGTRVAKGLALDDISSFLNLTAFFRNQWGYRPEPGEDDATFKERISAVLEAELDKAKASDLLIPQVVWGYFPANSDGRRSHHLRRRVTCEGKGRFHFPRQSKEPWLCIADFFRPVGEPDWAAFHLVTMGPEVSRETARLFSEDRYTEYLHLHGLGVELAEALAEYWHLRIRQEWGFADEDGPTLTGCSGRSIEVAATRSATPHVRTWRTTGLLPTFSVPTRIGVEVSEGFQLHPEQTTLALICHHPQAKYFVA